MPIQPYEDAGGTWAPVAGISSNPGPPVITTAGLADGSQGVPYSAQLSARGGTLPFTWAASGLPAGLSVSSVTGVISGTPSAAGTSSFTASLTDALGVVATAALTLTIDAVAVLAVTTASLPSGTQGAAYSATLAAISGVTPYAWTQTGGLPAGLTLNAPTGVISGTPSGTGTSSFTVTVTDASSATATAALSIRVVAAGALAITTTSVPGGTTGTAYSAPLAESGGTGPYTWSVSAGTLPAGLSISASTGTISGTPQAAGTSSFTVHVADSAAHTDTQALSIAVTSSLAVTTGSLPGGVKSAAYSAALAASGGFGAHTWTQTGGLPAGLALNASTGVISGTPTGTGTSSFTVTVTDAGGNTDTQALSVVVSATASAPLFGLNQGGGQGGGGVYWQQAYNAISPSAPAKPFGYSDYHGPVPSFPTTVGTMPADASWLLSRWNPPVPAILSGSQDANIRSFISSATAFIDANGAASLWMTCYHEVDAGNKGITGAQFINLMSYLYPRLKGTAAGWTGEPRLKVGQMFTGYQASSRLPSYLVCPNNGTALFPSPPRLDFCGFDRYSQSATDSAAGMYTGPAGCITAALAIQPDMTGFAMTEGNSADSAAPASNTYQGAWFAEIWAIAKAYNFPIFVPFFYGTGDAVGNLGWPCTAGGLTGLETILADSA